jgi:lysozyme
MIDLDALKVELKRDEGWKLNAYPDPIAIDGHPFTVGCGHTGPEVHAGLCWTDAECEAALDHDIATALASLDLKLPWWRNLSPVRQRVLGNLCFNVGITRLMGFHKALAAMYDGNFKLAASEMKDSAWYRQVGARAVRLCKMMEDG